MQSALDAERRVTFQAHPTGAGKSLIYCALAAAASDRRVLILTSTKALQAQVATEFGDALELVLIQGMNSYACDHPAVPKRTKASDGPCRAGADCELKTGGCAYYDQLARARKARVVLSNYHQWIKMGQVARRFGRPEPLGEFEVLVADEAHHAPTILSDALTVEFAEDEFASLLGRDLLEPGKGWEDWRAWGASMSIIVEGAKEAVAKPARRGDVAASKRLRRLTDLERVFQALAGASRYWVHSDAETAFFGGKTRGKLLRWGPARLSRDDVERVFLRDTPQALLVSATITPQTPELLALEEWEYLFETYPTEFPAARRPLVAGPGLRLNKNTTDATMRRAWAPAIDRIAQRRADRKGIVHVHSYARARIYGEETKLGGRVITHAQGARALERAVKEFRAAPAGAVLVSPVLTTGYDFPGEDCEYQVIAKLPYPFMGCPIFRARSKQTPGLGDYLTAQALVQACGRGMRSKTDQCETIFLDSAIAAWIERNPDKLPVWFLEAFSTSEDSPAPLPKLTIQ